MSNAFSPRLIQKILDVAGLDFHVLLTIIFRGWGILAGGITLILLPIWLGPTQQGYYYTFASLLALQVFFELGLNQVIIQLVSHEAAHLSFDNNGAMYGDANRIARLGGILVLVRRWYTIAALLFAVLASICGWFFFGRNGQTMPMNAWAPVWVLVVLLTAVNLFLSPQLAIIEGTGQVGQVARLRLIQSVVGYSLLWILLLLGAGLWVTVAVPLVSVVVTLFWLRTTGGWLKRMPSAASAISWRRDVFPLQWRIAVSWACGYFIFNLFTPIVFSSLGPQEAGKLGMALSVFNAVTSLGVSWVNAKSPNFTMHISRGEFIDLNNIFKSVSVRSVFVTAVLGLLVVGCVFFAAHHGVIAVKRIASTETLFWIACASVFNTGVYAAATYMRAHREEPMLPVSLITAALILGVILLTRDDVAHMMFGYAAIYGLFTLPYSFILLKKYQKRHQNNPVVI